MPGAWRAHVIEEKLRQHGIAAAVRETDIYSLDGDERTAVLDAVVRQFADFPMVVVGGRVACFNGIDPGAVLAAAVGSGCDDDCCC